MVVKKTSVATARPKVMTSHGAHAFVITLDTQTIVSPQACWLVVLRINPLNIVMDIAMHVIIVALVLVAALLIDMIAEPVITSWLLAPAKAKFTIPNTKTDLDQGCNHDQGHILVILKAWDTIMVTTFIMMTPGEGNGHSNSLPSLAQDWNANCPLLEPNLLLFYIKPRMTSLFPRIFP